mgnify:CR=1 FL=1
MSFISAFDVMGPNMIGPSRGSHTAGAAGLHFSQENVKIVH